MKKITLITGAGRGIGLEIAKKFIKENHDLILLVKTSDQVKSLKRIFKKNAGNVQYICGDLNNDQFLQSLKGKILKVDNLINNAALSNHKHFLHVQSNDLANIWQVNLKSVFEISQICAKIMIRNNTKGCIVSIGSQLGHIGAYNRSLYCMTKFGLEGLNKSMAMDLGFYGIRCNTVCPTKTIVNQDERKKTKKRLNIIKKKIPLRKFSTVKQISEIVYFLTSTAAHSITGTSIVSDGGWTAGK